MKKQLIMTIAAAAIGTIGLAGAASAAPAGSMIGASVATSGHGASIIKVRAGRGHNEARRTHARKRFYRYGPRRHARRCFMKRQVYWRHGRRHLGWTRVCRPVRHWR